jgi:hypothetical protein
LGIPIHKHGFDLVNQPGGQFTETSISSKIPGGATFRCKQPGLSTASENISAKLLSV